MRSETCRKGEIAKCEVLRRAYERDIVVSIPTIDADYDLVFDVDGKLIKAQVKYASGKPSNSTGSVFLDLRRTTRNGKVLTYQRHEVDVLLVYLADEDKVVWLPPDVWDGKSSVTIRTKPSKNRQLKGLRLASDYEW